MKLMTLFIFVIILSLPSPARSDDDYITFAKKLEANKYDNELPSIAVEQWITSTLPVSVVAIWGENVTDCGEQTGDPEIDKKRDVPLCAQIELKEKGTSIGYIQLFVGTEKKGKLKDSATLYYGYIKQGNKITQLKKLGEIIKLKGSI